MPNVINGTSTGSGGLITSGDDSGILNIQTNETTAITVDASQNIGIGVTPSAWGSSMRAIQIGTLGSFHQNDAGSFYGSRNSYNSSSGYKYLTTSTAQLFGPESNGGFAWYQAASGTAGNAITWTQAMTLDSSGNLLVGKTVVDDSTKGFAYRTDGYISVARNGGATCYFNRTGSDGGVVEIANDSSTVGTISVSGSSTAYNTSSDYRLKNTIAPITGALAKVAQLNPVTYKWNVDGSEGEGFIAHELAEICPQAVSGQKDAVDENGKPQYQGIDVSFLVATLTKAIQEQQAIIETLTQRITALEGA